MQYRVVRERNIWIFSYFYFCASPSIEAFLKIKIYLLSVPIYNLTKAILSPPSRHEELKKSDNINLLVNCVYVSSDGREVGGQAATQDPMNLENDQELLDLKVRIHLQ